MKKLFKIIFVYLIATNAVQAAPLEIEISNNKLVEFPVAVSDFYSKDPALNAVAKNISTVVKADLNGSDIFNVLYYNHNYAVENPDFNTLKSKKADLAVTAEVLSNGPGNIRVEYRVWEVSTGRQIIGKVLKSPTNGWRRMAHLISDKIYGQITGDAGYFDSRIVYISEYGSWRNRIKRLAIMDQDGANHKFLTPAQDLVLTPRFNPVKQEIIYIGYYTGIPEIYIYDLDRGRERSLGQFEGMNYAPRYSHDGRQIVFAMSKAGNSDIYTMSTSGSGVRRLTSGNSIETTPSFSPDSKQIVFASNKTGKQQLYVMNSSGSGVRKISRGKGDYATPVWSPNGKYVAFTKMMGGQFMIGVMRPDGSGERILTDAYMVESPTWSPNGRLLLFTKQTRNDSGTARSNLYSIDTETNKIEMIRTPQDASDPAWSPLLSRR